MLKKRLLLALLLLPGLAHAAPEAASGSAPLPAPPAQDDRAPLPAPPAQDDRAPLPAPSAGDARPPLVTRPAPATVCDAVLAADSVLTFELIEAGASVDTWCPNDSTPMALTLLMLAAKSGQVNVVDFLLYHGADLSLSKVRCVTAYTVAAAAGEREVVQRLREAGAPGEAEAGCAVDELEDEETDWDLELDEEISGHVAFFFGGGGRLASGQDPEAVFDFSARGRILFCEHLGAFVDLRTANGATFEPAGGVELALWAVWLDVGAGYAARQTVASGPFLLTSLNVGLRHNLEGWLLDGSVYLSWRQSLDSELTEITGGIEIDLGLPVLGTILLIALIAD